MGEMKNACIILIGKSQGTRPFGRPGCISEDRIKTYLYVKVTIDGGFLWWPTGL
jgi:hypothetical protein